MSSILMFWRYKLQEVQGKYMTPHLGESDMLTVVLLLEHNGAPLGAEAFRQITVLPKYPKLLAQEHSVTAQEDLT